MSSNLFIQIVILIIIAALVMSVTKIGMRCLWKCKGKPCVTESSRK